MRIEVDHNNLLAVQNPNIPQTKEYTYNVGGYRFSDYDKGIIVLHKKDWKIVNLKNLGDGMSVVYIKDGKIDLSSKEGKLKDGKLDGIHKALQIFQGFDENTGQKYYFIPSLGESQQKEKNAMLQKLGTKYVIQKAEKGMIIDGLETKDQHAQDALSFLFGLLCIYGKFDSKNGELSSIKIQLPLFGQYLKQQENLDIMIQGLQKEGMFLKADKLANKNGIIYQISSNDYELLEIFASWYEPVEKFTGITKREFTQDMKVKLIDFIQTNPEIPSEGKSEAVRRIKDGTIKFLTK